MEESSLAEGTESGLTQSSEDDKLRLRRGSLVGTQRRGSTIMRELRGGSLNAGGSQIAMQALAAGNPIGAAGAREGHE